jgi:hypothetical protein
MNTLYGSEIIIAVDGRNRYALGRRISCICLTRSACVISRRVEIIIIGIGAGISLSKCRVQGYAGARYRRALEMNGISNRR